MTAGIVVSLRNIRYVRRPARLMCKELSHTYIVLRTTYGINLGE